MSSMYMVDRIMKRKPTTKRKRLESTRSQASGISTLSNLTRSTDDLNDNFEASSQISRFNCNGDFQFGSRTDLINVVQPHVNNSSNNGQYEARRKRRVSFGVSDDEEETYVKEFNRQAQFVIDSNRSSENILLQTQGQSVDIYAQAPVVPEAFTSPVNRHGLYSESNAASHRADIPENEIEILRRKHAEQQRTIAFLLEKDKRREILLQKQRHCYSVTSLQAPAVMRDNEENCLQQIYPQRRQTNVQSKAFMGNQNDRSFIFPDKNECGVSQRRSRSCDFLFDDEEREQFLTPSPEMTPEESPNPFVSSGSEKGAMCTSVEGVSGRGCCNNKEPMDQKQSAKMCNYRCGFVLLLVLNAIIVSLNVVWIPTFSKDSPEEAICIECSAIDLKFNEKFQKMDETKCCLESASEMLQLFANVTNELAASPMILKAKKIGVELPMIQYRARKVSTIGNETRISWGIDEHPVQKVFGKLNSSDSNDLSTIIKVPVPGIYFIYSNIRFVRNHKIDLEPLTFNHSIVKLGGKKIESVTESCFPSMREIRHNSHLSFMHEFEANESLYVSVKLGNEVKILPDGTKFGMFFIEKSS